jgi:uncharacterized repeat protein (TIGR03837 family)
VTRRCDIFCRVVDNFGDIGVCWRLARQLGAEYGWQVRLFVDDLASFARIEPAIDPDKPQQRCGVSDIFAWNVSSIKDFLPETALVIEAFACELPDWYVAAMAAHRQPPAWVNLEYLSAETWVESHHLLPSPHPRVGLTKHFFFPGFTPQTGGLIRERDVQLPIGRAPQRVPQRAYVFGYRTPRTQVLVDALVASGQFQGIAVAAGTLAVKPDGVAPEVLSVAPFVPQGAFDAVLQGADFLVVRGEDSFVRAQWAARPFVWQIYPQAENAHLVKLRAFLDRYCIGLSAAADDALRQLWELVNDAERTCDATTLQARIDAVLAVWPELERHASQWATQLMTQTDLAARLVAWLESRSKNP